MRSTFVFLICLSFCGCAINSANNSPQHVILIGSDGLGAYCFKNAKIPAMKHLMENGAWSLKARSVLPSSSAVNWASMLMGSGPELHGFTEWGSKVPELPSRVLGESSGLYPSIFSLIEKQLPERKTGVFYTWGGIGYLFEKDMVEQNYNGESDPDTAEKAINFIVEEKPVFTFIHFSQPDGAGHNIGHDTPAYYDAVNGTDKLIGEVVSALVQNDMLEETVIIVSSDHGGVGKGHGGKSLLEVEIPWIIYGKDIPRSGEIASSIVTYDTAPTIADILNLEVPDFWRGKAVKLELSN